MIRKSINIILIISLVLLTFTPSLTVEAASKTLKDYKNELAKLENEKKENNRLTTENKNAINAKRNAIINANNTINTNEKKVEDAKAMVAESRENIKIKTEELQDVINVMQYSDINSDEIYLDYIFNSSSIAELMERQVVIEQIINYTQEQLDNLNKLIKENEELQVKLNNDNINLTNSISNYEKQVAELEAYIEKLANIGLDYDDQIKAQKNLIKMYEDAGCKDNDDVNDCFYNKDVQSGAFSRPLVSGKITQMWGNNGHKGIDIGGNPKGTSIYSPANGTVAYVAYKQSCGGNMVYIHHTVAGQAYTTLYAHMTQINVKAGDKVTKSTVIGTVGGDSSTFYYDSCTTGAHLHYAIAYGYYLGSGANGYRSWSQFETNTKATTVQSISGLKNTKAWSFSTRG